MNEHEPRPAAQSDDADWRRLEVAHQRFNERITDGIAMAMAEKGEIDDGTARMIAHVLGRAFGRESELANFGRTGGGNYLSLRDEYLYLYNSPSADAYVKEAIDWFGTYLVQRENYGSGRQFMNEHLPPKLDKLLVRTELYVQGVPYRVHLPASVDSGGTDALSEELINLEIEKDHALQAFLSLPDVDATTPQLMESFHEAYAGRYENHEQILRALSPLEDWENELADWCIDHGVDFEVLQWNYEPLIERLRQIYDLVERQGVIHAFAR